MEFDATNLYLLTSINRHHHFHLIIGFDSICFDHIDIDLGIEKSFLFVFIGQKVLCIGKKTFGNFFTYFKICFFDKIFNLSFLDSCNFYISQSWKFHDTNFKKNLVAYNFSFVDIDIAKEVKPPKLTDYITNFFSRNSNLLSNSPSRIANNTLVIITLYSSNLYTSKNIFFSLIKGSILCTCVLCIG